MFEKLVVSTSQKRKHRTAKFFVGTVALYAVVLACALVVSVLVSDPRLADTERLLAHVAPSLPAAGEDRPQPRTTTRSQPPARPDPRNAMKLNELLSRRDNPPKPGQYDYFKGDPSGSVPEGPFVVPGGGGGVPYGAEVGVEAPPKPDPAPQPKPVAQTTVVDNKPLHIPSTVLQGKATTRVTPPYPAIARPIRLQGDVSVEVMISPEGRVEAARVVSGHPVLAQAAKEAALGWRFSPTILNGVPVRVTGVIVFVFRFNE